MMCVVKTIELVPKPNGRSTRLGIDCGSGCWIVDGKPDTAPATSLSQPYRPAGDGDWSIAELVDAGLKAIARAVKWPGVT